LATVEALPQAAGLKDYVKSSWVGNKAFITERCFNKHGRFLAGAEYGDGGGRGYIIIPEGKDCKGWRAFALKL